MRSVAIIGSPHHKISNTYRLVKAVNDCLGQYGWDTTELFISDYLVNYCTGCGICLTKGECIQRDDTIQIQREIISSDLIILGSPVYFSHVTAQMKTFIDRCLRWSHRPSLFGKRGISVSVYAGVGDVDLVTEYLNNVMRSWGIFPIGALTALAVFPGDLPDDAIKSAKLFAKKIHSSQDGWVQQYMPNPDMRQLILDNSERFVIDYEYWKERGWLN